MSTTNIGQKDSPAAQKIRNVPGVNWNYFQVCGMIFFGVWIISIIAAGVYSCFASWL